MITPAQLEKRMRERGMGEAVIERVLRLNPNGIVEGGYARGIYRRSALAWWHWGRCVSKRKFIAEFGRDAWAAIPHGLKFRSGKRVFLSKEAYEDRAHEIYMGTRKVDAFNHFPTKRYANDTNCIREWRRTREKAT